MKKMPNEQIQMYSISRNEDDDDDRTSEETVVLRSPLAQHQPRAENREIVTLYTLDTARPIPSKVFYVKTPEDEKFFESQVVSQPIFYNIGTRNPRPIIEERISKSEMDETPVTLYTINARPRRSTIDIEKSPTNNVESSAIFYSVVATPRLSPQPTRTSRGTQVETPYEPTPILYTIIGDTPKKVKTNDVLIYGPNNEIYKGEEKRVQKKTTPLPPPSPMKNEIVSEEILTYPSGKTSIPTNSKESTPSKNETILLSHRPRVEPARPSHAFRTQKPHRLARTIQPKTTSLERRRTRPTRVDADQLKNQTDDEEFYGDQNTKKKRIYARPKARAPWVPVW